jgi:spore coat protein U-like protein
MNRRERIAAAAIAAAALLVLRFAQAATGSLISTATIGKVCVLTAGAVAFGNYDPVGVNSSTALDQSGSFTVACTKNTSYTVSLGTGLHAAGSTRQMSSGGSTPDYLAYELYLDAARTTVWNSTNMASGTAANISPVTLTVYGRIAPHQNVGAGSYTDTVFSTVNF